MILKRIKDYQGGEIIVAKDQYSKFVNSKGKKIVQLKDQILAAFYDMAKSKEKKIKEEGKIG